jgi:hypothetical protein
MLRKLPIGFLVVATLVIAANLSAKEPNKEKPLCERLYISNAVGSALELLDTELVQKEIGLTDAQKVKIVPLTKEMGESYDKIFRDNPETPASREEGKMELDTAKSYKGKDGSVTIPWKPRKPSEREIRINAATKEVDQRVQKQLDEILKPGQLDRIWEILLQSECFFQAGSELMGGLPDLDKELIKVLEISEDQLNEIQCIHREVESATSKAFAGFLEEEKKRPKEEGREMLHKRIQKLRPIVDRANKKILGELTPKQHEAIAKMKGKEIDFIKLVEQMNDCTVDADVLRKTPADEKK